MDWPPRRLFATRVMLVSVEEMRLWRDVSKRAGPLGRVTARLIWNQATNETMSKRMVTAISFLFML
jgi:hypothetical protein